MTEQRATVKKRQEYYTNSVREFSTNCSKRYTREYKKNERGLHRAQHCK